MYPLALKREGRVLNNFSFFKKKGSLFENGGLLEDLRYLPRYCCDLYFILFLLQGLPEIRWDITVDLRFQPKIATMIKTQATVLWAAKEVGGLTTV